MNSYMNMTLWIHIVWIRIWIWHYEFMVFEFMYMNSEHTLNSYTWIQTTWIHSVIFIYEFIVFSEFIYMNSDTMNSQCHIHIWIHMLWIHSRIFIYEFMNIWIHIWIRHYEFMSGYTELNGCTRHALRHRTCQCSAQALGLQTARKCSHSHLFSQFQRCCAGCWYIHVLIFQVGTRSPQGATGLDSFRPPNGSSVACASYNQGNKLGDSSLKTRKHGDSMAILVSKLESICKAFELAS